MSQINSEILESTREGPSFIYPTCASLSEKEWFLSLKDSNSPFKCCIQMRRIQMLNLNILVRQLNNVGVFSSLITLD